MKNCKISFVRNTPSWLIENVISGLSDIEGIKFHHLKEGGDYLFATPFMYSSFVSFSDFLDKAPSAITIMHCVGEAIMPDLNIFDYYIGFYPEACGDRIIQRLYERELRRKISECKKRPAVQILKEKKAFCNFIYSNGKGHPMRGQLFDLLSHYRKVDAPGRYKHNIDILTSRHNKDWLSESIDLKNPYKFSISAENAWFPGYTSEKLLTSMLADTLPIYWGNPEISNEFNPDSFIHVDHYSNLNELLEFIIRVDLDDELWCRIMDEPLRLKKQIEEDDRIFEHYVKRYGNIFKQPIEKAFRKGNGYFEDMYRNQMKAGMGLRLLNENISSNCMKFIKNMPRFFRKK